MTVALRIFALRIVELPKLTSRLGGHLLKRSCLGSIQGRMRRLGNRNRRLKNLFLLFREAKLLDPVEETKLGGVMSESAETSRRLIEHVLAFRPSNIHHLAAII